MVCLVSLFFRRAEGRLSNKNITWWSSKSLNLHIFSLPFFPLDFSASSSAYFLHLGICSEHSHFWRRQPSDLIKVIYSLHDPLKYYIWWYQGDTCQAWDKRGSFPVIGSSSNSNYSLLSWGSHEWNALSTWCKTSTWVHRVIWYTGFWFYV